MQEYLTRRAFVVGYEVDGQGNRLTVHLRYQGPEKLRWYIDAIFDQLRPHIEAYEERMQRFEQREAHESLIIGVKGAIPYVLFGIAFDFATKLIFSFTGITYLIVRKIIEIPIRWAQGNADTYTQFRHLQARKTQGAEVRKSLRSVRYALMASILGPAAMLLLPLLPGVDVTRPSYFIAVTMAASTDNFTQAITKAWANYKAAGGKGFVRANRGDATVSGNLMGTTSIAVLDIGLRFIAESVGRNTLLGLVSAMAGESGFLGPFDSEVAALNVGLSKTQERMKRWAPIFDHKNLTKIASQSGLA